MEYEKFYKVMLLFLLSNINGLTQWLENKINYYYCSYNYIIIIIIIFIVVINWKVIKMFESDWLLTGHKNLLHTIHDLNHNYYHDM